MIIRKKQWEIHPIYVIQMQNYRASCSLPTSSELSTAYYTASYIATKAEIQQVSIYTLQNCIVVANQALREVNSRIFHHLT
jgi:hypothetical protein